MKAMVLASLGPIEANSAPLELREIPVPAPRAGEILLRVAACGVCRTEIDEIEGRLPPPQLPVVPGHQVVGRVEQLSSGRQGRHAIGDRVGVAWIHSACGTCAFCLSGRENLCPGFRATGRDVDGGYAAFMTVPEASAFPLPAALGDTEVAPLLCAGAIGYRSLRLAGTADGQTLGLTGFGASGHLVLKMARVLFPGIRIFVFARSETEKALALSLGAAWTGDPAAENGLNLDAIIDTTPAWLPVVEALRHLAPGGRLVINAIRKEDGDRTSLLQIDYPSHLWMEKEIKSVANITRRDVREFLALAGECGLKPEVETYALEDANKALVELKTRRIRGAKVLKVL